MEYNREQIQVLKGQAEKVIRGKGKYEQEKAGEIIKSLCEQLLRKGICKIRGPIMFINKVKREGEKKKLRIGDTVRFWEGSVIVTGKNIEKLERWKEGEEERKEGEVEKMIEEVKEEVRERKRRKEKA